MFLSIPACKSGNSGKMRLEMYSVESKVHTVPDMMYKDNLKCGIQVEKIYTLYNSQESVSLATCTCMYLDTSNYIKNTLLCFIICTLFSVFYILITY